MASDVLRGKPEREKSKCSAIRNLVSAAPQKWAGLVVHRPAMKMLFRFTNAVQFLAECSVLEMM
jgi:hypothetical protein